MIWMIINTKELKIAAVRYFDKDKNGLELTDPISHVVLLNRGATYISLFSPGELAPIYKRLPCTANKCGLEDSYGTKIKLVSGEVQTGEAWLLTDTDFYSVFGKGLVSLRDVEDYVIESGDYFHDRADIIRQRISSERLPIRDKKRLLKIVQQDEINKGNMDSFFKERGVQKLNVK